MKTILAVLLLIPGIVSAQTFGCYYQNYSSTCSFLPVNCSFNFALDQLNYGYTVANLCDKYGASLVSWDSETKRADYNANGWAQCISDRDYNAGGWAGCATAAQANIGLIKRLRRVCGTKCKRIK